MICWKKKKLILASPMKDIDLTSSKGNLYFYNFYPVYGISFPWTYVDRGISPEDLSPEVKDPYL